MTDNEKPQAHEHDPDCEDCETHEHQEPYQRLTPKTGRNDPCPCNSGKKYKKCCL